MKQLDGSALDLRDRSGLFRKLKTEQFDLLVIGGGITGAGIARDAAMRGLHVALVEAQDFASGTSSRSTKLIHGGLRYLAQGDINLVRESASERAVLEILAPHLAQTQHFLLPVPSKAAQIKFRTGLWAYEKLGNVADIDTHKVLSMNEIHSQEPALQTNGWHSAITYGECITEDARLTLANIRSAHKAGAILANYCKVTGFCYRSEKRGEKNGEKVSGVLVQDTLDQDALSQDSEIFEIKAKVIVNAAGPWVDLISKMGSQKRKGETPTKLQLTKGVHIVVPHKVLPLNNPLIATASDKRTLFIIPKEDITYIGTTDTFYSSSDYWPKADISDIEYLLDTANRATKVKNIQHQDICSLWTGIRPLIAQTGKSPSEISRKDETWESEDGLLSIAGGKLTAYRRMAERVIDLVEQKLGKNSSICPTASEALPGGEIHPDVLRQKTSIASLDKNVSEKLIRNYGSEALSILEKALSAEDIIQAEIEQSVLKEGALRLEDYWIRRSGRSLFDVDAGLSSLHIAASKMAELLTWTREKELAEISHCQSIHVERMDWSIGTTIGTTIKATQAA